MTWLGFPPLDKLAEESVKTILDERFEGIRKATPGGGSYMNEVSFSPPLQRYWTEYVGILVDNACGLGVPIRKGLAAGILGRQLRAPPPNQAAG